MLKRSAIAHQQRRLFHSARAWCQARSIIKVRDGTFYRSYPAPTDTPDANPPLFKKLNFSLPAGHQKKTPIEYWAIISPSSLARTTFLQVLGGRHFCDPPTARTYPHLAELSISPHNAVKYVGFDADRGNSVGGNSVRGAYLSARYESRREETDYSLHNYLTGHTELNALEHDMTDVERKILEEVIDQLNLRSLLDMPVANLSNGQTRRARIAKALMARPEVLLLDGPFMGLDPRTSSTIGEVLHKIAISQAPRLIISLRLDDGIPDWITHVVLADSTSKILDQGSRQSIMARNPKNYQIMSMLSNNRSSDVKSTYVRSKDAYSYDSPALPPGEPLVEMRGVQIKYGDKIVLGNWHQTDPTTGTPHPTPGLHWSLHRGQRTAIFGPNGSGKTTMLSLITSDHPQTYAQPILHFSRSRLPAPGEPGISLFDLQARTGHSSPEIHAFFPKHLSVRQVLESAWAETPLTRPKLTAPRDRVVDATLRWFARELNPHITAEELTSQEKLNAACSLRARTSRKQSIAQDKARKAWNDVMYDDSDLLFAEQVRFRDLSFSSQRLALFLRAIVGSPDLVILDEALSGVDAKIRDKALLWLSQGEKIECVEGALAVESVQARLGGEKMAFQGLEDRQALVVIAHEKGDVPGCVREWICLPQGEEKGVEPRVGVLGGPLELRPDAWEAEIWGANVRDSEQGKERAAAM